MNHEFMKRVDFVSNVCETNCIQPLFDKTERVNIIIYIYLGYL